MTDTRLTITIPGRVTPALLGRLVNWLERRVREVTGMPCEITVQIPQSIREAAQAARDEPIGDLTREQDQAAQKMAMRFGRSHVKPLEDGTVEITGLTDDVVRETLRFARDGRQL